MATDQPPRDGERQSDLAVMDANEYKQKRRLERILDALDDVQDTADAAWANYVSGEISREARNITIQRTVKNAIRECYKLLLDHHKTVEEAGNGPDRYWAGKPEEHLGAIELGGEQLTVIKGLRDFLESPTFFTTTVTETVTQRNMPPRVQNRTIETTMPEAVSYRAYLRLKEFLDDVHDMEIAFEELDDKLADTKPTSVEVPEGTDLSDVETFADIDAPVDARAVTGDDD